VFRNYITFCKVPFSDNIYMSALKVDQRLKFLCMFNLRRECNLIYLTPFKGDL
jgi:hypothetical protein